MAEYYRQFSFVSSVLAGFACAFYGMFLAQPSTHRAVSWAALASVTASVAFLAVTLGTTFAAAFMAGLPAHAALPASMHAQLVPISLLFLGGILLLLVGFGLGGWTRSRRLGIATTTVAVVGVLAAIWALGPFLATP